MRRAAAAATAVGLLLGLAGCSSGGGNNDASSAGFGKLTWDETPQLVRLKTMPNDWILSGHLRNDSFKIVKFTAAKDVELVDADGKAVAHTAIFAEGYSRDIYPPRDRRQIPEQDQIRLGIKAKIRPGDVQPITVAWRVKGAKHQPVKLRLGSGELKVPPPGAAKRG